ncbi:group II intron reverse transcriptase/maturase [Methylohalobius crimeensis]|uniref:group II intron reverse transcriptase/maturase n=1 Tax=Methylohalobius crimeensis TaxID=244365 RepID=UPI0003B6A292|nr:group II intron reverse transcriptase/maturase [Methylohalobius crimeensis]
MVLRTPEKIRTLQRKLYTKANQEPDFRFYALYDKLCRADILSHAYRRVRSNKGAPGVDGQTFEAIEAEEGEAQFLQRLQKQLESKTYQADAVRRVGIPKPDGSKRPLGIPTIRDRVVQMAAKIVLEPIFEADFCEHSYGFRPKRSAHDAVDAVADALLSGHAQVIDADLSKYFDTLPHAKLLAAVAERISDGAVLALIKQWLKAPVVEEDDDGTRRTRGGGKSNRRGTPQGGVISPLLANLYLHLLDRIWERHGLETRYRCRLVRYADDIVALCAGDVEAPLAALRQILEKLDLSLNETKTRVVDAREESFDFLGFSFRVKRSCKSGKHYPHVEPSKQAVQRIKDRTKALTDRRRTPVPMPMIMGELNATLRGWSNYFHHRNCTRVMSKVKLQVEERVRIHLRRRHKLASRGYHRFPGRIIYGRYGLFKLPTTAPWRSAHASV